VPYHTLVYPIPTLVHLVNWEQLNGEKDRFDKLLFPALNPQIGLNNFSVLFNPAIWRVRMFKFERSTSPNVRV